MPIYVICVRRVIEAWMLVVGTAHVLLMHWGQFILSMHVTDCFELLEPPNG